MSVDECPRIFRAEPVPLFSCKTTNTVTGSKSNAFRVGIPDPRLWVKFGVIFLPDDGTTVPAATTQTLWIAALDRTGLGDQGRELPVEDLIGTSVAPLAIPVNTTLYGKYAQLQTGSTGLQGVLTINAPTVQGTWLAKATFWPTVNMPREEWDHLKGLLGGVAADGVFNLQV